MALMTIPLMVILRLAAQQKGMVIKMSAEEIFKTMQSLIVEQFALEPEDVTLDSSFEDDLGADSVDIVELVMAIEEEFEIDEIPEEELVALKTVGDCVRYLAGKLN